MKKLPNRSRHIGRSLGELAAYKNYLVSSDKLDKTEPDPIDSSKTDESSFEEEPNITLFDVKRKSVTYKIKDFFSNNFAITIIGGIIVGVFLLIITWNVTLYREQGVQAEQIASLNKSTVDLLSANKSISDSIRLFKDDFTVFRVETTKDLEYVKKKLKLWHWFPIRLL